jgi:hypothetical protein
MKNLYPLVFMLLFPFLMQSQMEYTPTLKQINIVRTNFKDSKSGEIVNKQILFKEGKIESIKTSDVTQSFFYNTKGLLDKTVKEKTGSNWKEVINYTYDEEDRITKFVKKYQEDGQFVTKKVNFSYDGSRIKLLTQKSDSHDDNVENVEFIVENGIVVRRTCRDRNQQIINKTEYIYSKENAITHKGLVGDKATQNYNFDDKNSVNLLIVKGLFGRNYKVIVPIISYHESEFEFASISNNNLINYTSTSTKYIGKSSKYKYNNFNYPASQSLIEENGIVKTELNYIYDSGTAIVEK